MGIFGLELKQQSGGGGILMGRSYIYASHVSMLNRYMIGCVGLAKVQAREWYGMI